MIAILGIFSRNVDNQTYSMREKIRAGISVKDAEGWHIWQDGPVILGHGAQTPNSIHVVTSQHLVIVAAGRIDNRSDLFDRLGIDAEEGHTLSDSDLMQRAYCQWGEHCSRYLLGDWVLAAWHQSDRRLVMSRSHYGSIALYYHVDQDLLVFASNRQTLLDLGLVSFELDDLWLAQYITSWLAHYGEATPHKPVKCLPPAHYIIASQNSHTIHQYWNPEQNSELVLSRREEYVEAFRSIFDEAVRCRLRSDGPIAVSLSGGLDSGSVASTAAAILAEKGQRLKAFTSVPTCDTERYLSKEYFGDEFPFAKAVADFSGNIDLYPIESADKSPLAGIRHLLTVGRIPVHGATSVYWMMEVRQAVIAAGCKVLLTGAAGNGAFSWTGNLSSQSLGFVSRHYGWQKSVEILLTGSKTAIKSVIPKELLIARQIRQMEHRKWFRLSAINPDFAQRIHLLDQRLSASEGQSSQGARVMQSQILRPGRSVVGGHSAEIAAAQGVDVRDPTCDARILDFVYSVPDHIFMDPETGIDRWLVREAMKGRLPDAVRLNRKRGRQAADIIPRLRAASAEVEQVLDELAAGAAAEYVDVDYMRHIWCTAKSCDTDEARIATIQILLRGIMAGLFVNGFYESEDHGCGVL